MKATFKTDKSSVMKRAWAIKKGKTGWAFTFSQCLKRAWKEEKSSIARMNDKLDRQYGRGKYSPANIAAIDAMIPKTNVSLAFMADTLIDYYAYNTYNGD